MPRLGKFLDVVWALNQLFVGEVKWGGRAVTDIGHRAEERESELSQSIKRI